MSDPKTKESQPKVGSGALVLPLRIEDRATTGSPKADRMIEQMVSNAVARIIPVLTAEIIKSLKGKIDIIE